MTNSKRTLKKLSHESWELRLSVDSKEIESLKWIWTAEVSLGDGSDENTITIGYATHGSGWYAGWGQYR